MPIINQYPAITALTGKEKMLLQYPQGTMNADPANTTTPDVLGMYLLTKNGLINSVANIGNAGQGLFSAIVNNAAQFYNLAPGSSKVTVALNSAQGNVLVDIAPANIDRNSLGGGLLSLANGGTNAALVAALGGIIYSGTTGLKVLAPTTTGKQVLMAGASSDPVWSSFQMPMSTTINNILYSSANNIISEITTANNGVLVTSGSGVPSISSALPASVQANITQLGTISSVATPLSGSVGGTGVANTGKTITVGGNLLTAAAFTQAGAFATTLTSTATTNSTLPAGTTTLVPTTGTGATGIWNISITGNAGTVTTNANLTGDVNSTGNSTTIAANAVSYAKIQTASAGSLLGNPTGAVANVSEVKLGAGLSFSANLLNTVNNGTVTNVATGLGLTGGPINSTGTIAMLGTLPTSIQSNITQLGTITSGVWNGTPIAITNGGTGTTTATGTGSVVLSNTPTLVTPILGIATATSLQLTQASNQIAFGTSALTIFTVPAPATTRSYTVNDLGANGNVLLSTTTRSVNYYSGTAAILNPIVWTGTATTTTGIATFYPNSTGAAGGTTFFPNSIVSAIATASANTTTATSYPFASIQLIAANRSSVTVNVGVGVTGGGIGAATIQNAPNGTVVYLTIWGN